MSAIRLDPATLTVQDLTPWEHVFALRGNVTVPRADIVSGAVVTDARAAAPAAFGPPGLVHLGFGRWGPGGPRGSRTLVSVRRGQPAVQHPAATVL